MVPFIQEAIRAKVTYQHKMMLKKVDGFDLKECILKTQYFISSSIIQDRIYHKKLAVLKVQEAVGFLSGFWEYSEEIHHCVVTLKKVADTIESGIHYKKIISMSDIESVAYIVELCDREILSDSDIRYVGNVLDDALNEMKLYRRSDFELKTMYSKYAKSVRRKLNGNLSKANRS